MAFWTNLDKSIFFFFHNLSGKSVIADGLIVFLGEYFIYVVGIIFVWVAFLDFRKIGFEPIVDYAVAVIAALTAKLVVGWGIESFYYNSRPFVELSLPHLLTDFSYSFPSGHTIFIFALATSVFFFNRKFSYFLFASGLLIGLSRVAGAVHYPSDIAGGMILGTVVGLLVHGIWYLLFVRASDRENVKENVKTVSFVFLLSFALNFIWEHAHSVLYIHYQGGEITDFVLFRAAITDALMLSVLAIPFLCSTFLRSRLWLSVPVGIALAVSIEWNALQAGWWAYHVAMPIIPLLGTGLTPTLQLGLTGYVAYRFFIKKQNI
ncbi:MAG: phosphatase PAP2 family protein [Patescibacteria group bacterium]|nr:phosphatase PAP2 family protein [bacterium]MDZ4240534.1 phosphatase PAP2 family protein [Patescibacteria group bacterium]